MASIGGQYVGLGLGDSSPVLVELKVLLKKKFTPARLTLDDGPEFTLALDLEVRRVQMVYLATGKMRPDQVLPGIVNHAFKKAVGLIPAELILPLHFSVEGHLSDMWIGPAAHVGNVLHAESRAIHMPTGYDRWALPFKNKTGVDALVQRVGATETRLEDGRVIRFPKGTPWTASAFSQGSMIWCDFYRQYLLPGKPLNWRLKDLRAAIVCGNPDREKGVVAPWIQDPPDPDRQGIMDDENRMVNTPWWWLEIARKGDAYTDNQSSGERGANKTAVARLITQGKWTGGPVGLVARLGDVVTGPIDDIIPIAMSLYDMIRFGVNMGVHGIYPMDPAIQFCRERLAAAA